MLRRRVWTIGKKDPTVGRGEEHRLPICDVIGAEVLVATYSYPPRQIIFVCSLAGMLEIINIPGSRKLNAQN